MHSRVMTYMENWLLSQAQVRIIVFLGLHYCLKTSGSCHIAISVGTQGPSDGTLTEYGISLFAALQVVNDQCTNFLCMS